MTRHLKKFEKTLYGDMLKHLKQTDQEVPWPWGDFLYYSRTEEGKVRGDWGRPRPSARVGLLVGGNKALSDPYPFPLWWGGNKA